LLALIQVEVAHDSPHSACMFWPGYLVTFLFCSAIKAHS
jgi:hypothetical protein